MKRRTLCLICIPFVLACGPFFYSAPPTLFYYPERIASKSWELLLDDAHAPSGQSKDELLDELSKLVEEFGELDAREVTERIQEIQQKNRDGEFSIKLANLLEEMGELMEGVGGLRVDPLPRDEVAAYLKQRIRDVPGPQLDYREPVQAWDMTDEQYQDILEAHRKDLKKLEDKFNDWLESCPPALKPNVRVQRAAFLFRSAQYERALKDFDQVTLLDPDNPRAEVAMFMRGRCILERARALIAPDDREPDAKRLKLRGELLDTARQVLEHYIEAYPKGRFIADAQGWIGAVYLEQGLVVDAINQQIIRYHMRPTREVAYSVMRELDSLLPQVYDVNAYHAESIDYERLIRLPGLTRQFVYHCLDVSSQGRIRDWAEGEDGGRDLIKQYEALRVRGEQWSGGMLAGLASAVAASKRPVDPLSAWVLGWSLVRAERPAEALAIVNAQTLQDVPLLQLKAKACHDLGRYDEELEALTKLIEADPADSSLHSWARFEHALACYRVGRAGDALLELLEILFDQEQDSQTATEALQWADTLAQFGPLRELRDTLEAMPPDDPNLPTMRMVVRSRFLCRGSFTTARRYLDVPREEDDGQSEHTSLIAAMSRLDQERWDKEVEPLALTLEELQSVSGVQKARLHMKAASQWAALRGRLTLPLHVLMDFSASEDEKLDDLRRINGRVLGLDDRWIASELDQRDELHHALQHWKAVIGMADATDEMRREALFRANEALFQLAEFSPYRLSRALEERHSELSAEWVGRLKEQFADSPEAKAAIAWQFDPPVMLPDWMPGNDPGYWLAEVVDTALAVFYKEEWEEDPAVEQMRKDAQKDFEQLNDALKALANSKDPVADTQAILKKFNELRPMLQREDILSVVDNIDDLHTAAHIEGVTPELFRTYFMRRTQMDSAPIHNGELLDSLVAYIDTLNKVRDMARDDAGRQRQIEAWNAYIRSNPQSPKLEAASMRILRLKVRAMVAHPKFRTIRFPEAPIAIGHRRISFDVKLQESEKIGLLAEIAAYRERFPAGRYAADVDLLEASVHGAAADPAKALSLLVRVLNDKRHAELRQDAALAFCSVTMQLLNGLERADVVAALRANPGALEYLELLADAETPLARVRPMLAALKVPGK